ncbi:hypothetical protein QWJ34_08960 [Saccharibacillus sp. CPCC 101409]|uniref:hypothetical protein n=1 Tax=Saccharibacillus sp. CPCC 101409 TaxID=3058041 RepID=UPI002670D0A8|nr:hypothetical protein [Saccharibacillus sp. CPCC 101409]MDO3409890.1 hypothetical protein [Saccharibacillus sp. CPCC 101409]
MQKFLGIDKTTFSNLEYMYSEILEARDLERNRLELDHKKGREVNAKITFHHYDGYLRCKEIFEGTNLIEYYYDWYAGNGEILQKFHAHYHTSDTPEEIKKFDPWHWHVPQGLEDKDGHRIEGPPGFTIHEVLSQQVLPYILRVRRSQK